MAVKTNVNKNGNKYFRITRTIGHKEDGTPVKKEFYGNSKSDAEEKAQQYINDLKNGLIASAEDYTVSQLMPLQSSLLLFKDMKAFIETILKNLQSLELKLPN